jgi:putative ABC transport system permease protein
MNDYGRSQFPFHQAFLFAVQGIRLRLGRMLLVLAGVAVAIAFTNVLLTSRVLFQATAEKIGTQAQGMILQGIFRWLWLAVALLICTAGTLNAIVMSVTERIKEIGTLKCLGSRDIHIVEIFLLESILLGSLGGVLGGVLGWGAALLNFVAAVGAKHLTWEMAVGPQTLMYIPISMGISSGLALLASVVPVFMAAKVEPAAAMRYEV